MLFRSRSNTTAIVKAAGSSRLFTSSQASGVETETAAGWMLKFSKGKLMRFRAFRAPEEALEAVGLEA